MSKEFKFLKSKTIHEAIFEIAVDTHSPFCPIWWIFLPVYHRPSKRANGMILIFMKICCLLSPFNEFYIRLLCSFQFHQNILKYTVNIGKLLPHIFIIMPDSKRYISNSIVNLFRKLMVNESFSLQRSVF